MLALLLRPKFWPGHLAMLVCVGIATGLGLWQYDAWQLHRADAARDLADDPAVPLGELMTGDSPFPGRSVGQPVTFRGAWTGSNVYVADREHEGRDGYWVVTALSVDDTGSAMPVVRGWWPTTDLPDPTGETTVTGWLQPTEGSGGVDEDPQDDVIPTMRTASLVEKVDADLYSGYVIAEELADHDGIPPVEPVAVQEVSATTALRNLLYAIEWWIFGGFALFVWVRWCRDSVADPVPADAVLPPGG